MWAYGPDRGPIFNSRTVDRIFDIKMDHCPILICFKFVILASTTLIFHTVRSDQENATVVYLRELSRQIVEGVTKFD